MAKIIFKSTTASKLSELPIVDGQLIFVKDTHSILLDNDSKRIKYEQIIILQEDTERTSILAPITNIFYFVEETNCLWKYKDGWVLIYSPISAKTKTTENVEVAIDENGKLWVPEYPDNSNYMDLSNKPKLNGVEIAGNKTSTDYKIVSSEQGIENNGKFLGVGVDGNVTSVDKPTYTADEVGARPDTWTPSAEDVGALPNDTEIPSKTSDLENDSGFITNSDIPEKLPNPQKIIFTGAVTAEYDGSSQQTINIPIGGSTGGGTTNYNDLSNKPQLSGVTLEGNKTLDDIGVQPKGNYLTSVPQASSTIVGGIKAESAGVADTVPVKIKSDGTLVVPTYPEGGSADIPRQEMQNTDTAVTLEPNKLYIFPEMTSLTVTLAEPSDTNVANEYHFFFTSGNTATTLTLNDVLSDAYSVDANMKYEVSILENVAYIKGGVDE